MASIGARAAASIPTLTNIVVEEQPSPSNSNTAKSATVSCPAGQSVINASGSISGGGGKVVMDDIFPDQAVDSVTVSGKETDPTTASWIVTARATCADTPSGGIKWYEGASASNSGDDKSATAGCNPGEIMLGTGMDIVGGQGEVGAYSIDPLVDAAGAPDAVTVRAAETDPLPSTSSWLVHAIALCVDETSVSNPLVVSADAAPSTSGTAGVTVYCPSGYVSTGTGADVSNGAGEVIFSDINPGGSPSTAPDRSSPFAYEEDGTSNVWTLTGHVICVLG